MRPSRIVFALICLLAFGQLMFAAPSGRFLVMTPAAEKVVPGDPSIRHGSAGSRTTWFFVGGGYHGGK